MGSFIYVSSLLILTTAMISAANACPLSDKAALVAFKNGLQEYKLGIFNTWKGDDCCKGWYGVSCDPVVHRVADINLRGESEDPILANKTGFMTGSISPEICKLERLSSLTIADWKGITGPIPECITTLPFLRIIDLIGNKLTGRLPAELGRLNRLNVLNVADNALNGRIPRSIANLSDLKHLDLRNNRFSGGIPRTFGRLRMLSRALLSGNRFIGPIPNSVSYIYRLADLDLSMNRLSGPIPPSLGKMPVLATLNLDGNNFSGSIPPALLSSGITIVNLSRNAIDGKIPNAFTTKSYFMVMDLSYNKLSGTIPSSIKSASYIGHLDVSHNHLCGPIPTGPPFDRLEASSFVFNDCLCGKPLRAC